MASTLTDVFGGESQVKEYRCQKTLPTLREVQFGKKKEDENHALASFLSLFLSLCVF